jgi:hypothetical protein
MRGVFQRYNGRWGAVIMRNGEKRTLGTFDTEEEAIKARLEAEANIHFVPTYKEKMEMAQSRHAETMAEINNPELYKDNIKMICFRCKKFLNNNWDHYRHYGNFCQKCSGDVNFKLKDSFYKKRYEVQGNIVALPPKDSLPT